MRSGPRIVPIVARYGDIPEPCFEKQPFELPYAPVLKAKLSQFGRDQCALAPFLSRSDRFA